MSSSLVGLSNKFNAISLGSNSENTSVNRFNLILSDLVENCGLSQKISDTFSRWYQEEELSQNNAFYARFRAYVEAIGGNIIERSCFFGIDYSTIKDDGIRRNINDLKYIQDKIDVIHLSVLNIFKAIQGERVFKSSAFVSKLYSDNLLPAGKALLINDLISKAIEYLLEENTHTSHLSYLLEWDVADLETKLFIKGMQKLVNSRVLNISDLEVILFSEFFYNLAQIDGLSAIEKKHLFSDFVRLFYRDIAREEMAFEGIQDSQNEAIPLFKGEGYLIWLAERRDVDGVDSFPGDGFVPSDFKVHANATIYWLISSYERALSSHSEFSRDVAQLVYSKELLPEDASGVLMVRECADKKKREFGEARRKILEIKSVLVELDRWERDNKPLTEEQLEKVQQRRERLNDKMKNARSSLPVRWKKFRVQQHLGLFPLALPQILQLAYAKRRVFSKSTADYQEFCNVIDQMLESIEMPHDVTHRIKSIFHASLECATQFKKKQRFLSEFVPYVERLGAPVMQRPSRSQSESQEVVDSIHYSVLYTVDKIFGFSRNVCLEWVDRCADHPKFVFGQALTISRLTDIAAASLINKKYDQALVSKFLNRIENNAQVFRFVQKLKKLGRNKSLEPAEIALYSEVFASLVKLDPDEQKNEYFNFVHRFDFLLKACNVEVSKFRAVPSLYPRMFSEESVVSKIKSDTLISLKPITRERRYQSRYLALRAHDAVTSQRSIFACMIDNLYDKGKMGPVLASDSLTLFQLALKKLMSVREFSEKLQSMMEAHSANILIEQLVFEYSLQRNNHLSQ